MLQKSEFIPDSKATIFLAERHIALEETPVVVLMECP